MVPEQTMNWNENIVSIVSQNQTVLALYGIAGADCT